MAEYRFVFGEHTDIIALFFQMKASKCRAEWLFSSWSQASKLGLQQQGMTSSSLFPTGESSRPSSQLLQLHSHTSCQRDTDNRCAISIFINALSFMVLTWVLALLMVAFQFLVLTIHSWVYIIFRVATKPFFLLAFQSVIFFIWWGI